MIEPWIDAVGIIPAIVFPGASLIQLLALLKRRKADGVSVVTWWMFAAANICVYIYTQKYFELTAIVAFLGTAVLNAAVAITASRFKNAPD